MELYNNLEYPIKWTLNVDKSLQLDATIYDKSGNNKLGTIKNGFNNMDRVFPGTSEIILSDSKGKPILVSTNSAIYDVSNMDDKIPLGIVTSRISFFDRKDLKSLNKHETFLTYKNTGGGDVK